MFQVCYQYRNGTHVLENLRNYKDKWNRRCYMGHVDMAQSVLSREVLIHRVHHPSSKMSSVERF